MYGLTRLPYHPRPMFTALSVARTSRPTIILAVCKDRLRVPHAYRSNTEAKAALKGTLSRGAAGALSGDGRFLTLGLGESKKLTTRAARDIGAKLVKALHAANITSAILVSDELDERLGRAIGEGLGLANWSFDTYRGTASKRAKAAGRLTIEGGDTALHRGLSRGLRLSESVNVARAFAATPPNICNPTWVAGHARALGRSSRLRCRIIDAKQAKRLGLGGLLAVGQASDSPPCLVVLEHKPARARGPHVALVGKTITYDTGGYSLKVNNGMKGMKYDKCGGAAVLGAMHAIAAAKLPIRVTAVLACAENMVAGNAYRPDDIITLHNGVTVEVTNTDAEGRLVLADALSWVESVAKPDLIVDLATLTGGVVVALGHFCAGYFCGDAALRKSVESAATETDERVWQLPLWEDHRDFMRSDHADILNSNPARSAHPIQGAAFLSYFVNPETPWAHIDIAGVGNTESAKGPTGVGPTGFGVRLLASLAEELAAKR